jgi:hypothetical protein
MKQPEPKYTLAHVIYTNDIELVKRRADLKQAQGVDDEDIYRRGIESLEMDRKK